MAQSSPGRVRFAGLIMALGTAALLAIGLYLTHLALHWPMPGWVPAAFRVVPKDPALGLHALSFNLLGRAAAFLLVFSALAGINALWMLIFGQRNRLLVGLILVMFLLFVGFSFWVAMGNV
ncbi:MAG: hypothetical protein ABI832_02465 [bacterium]